MNRTEMHEQFDLAWILGRTRQEPDNWTLNLIKRIDETGYRLNRVEVEKELAAALETCRLHEKCKEHCRKYGPPIYRTNLKTGYSIPSHLCEGCAKPLFCTSESKEHEYTELSVSESRKLGIYHGGNCYHVQKCKHCGHVSSYDSSD